MLDDQSNLHNNADPLEDYMASFFSLPAETPCADSDKELLKEPADLPLDLPLELSLEVPLNSKSLSTDNASIRTLKAAYSTDNVDEVTDDVSVNHVSDFSGITRLNNKTSANSSNTLKHVNVFKKHLDKPCAQQSASNKQNLLLDNQQKKNLQKLLDKSLNQPLLEYKKTKVPDANPNLAQSYSSTKQKASTASKQKALGDTALTSFNANNVTPDSGDFFNSQQAQPLQSDLLKPSVSQPEVNKTEVNKTEAIEPEAFKPEAIEPEVIKPKAFKPEAFKVEYRSHWLNNKPAWAQNTFDALLFQCRGVTLAIPLISLGYIYLHNQPLKKLPNLPSWVLGIKPLDTGQLKVIDAGAYFFPERTPSLNIDADLHLLSLADCLWGFAVDSLSNPIRVEADDVQWRSLSANNPWLAGTIKKQMCVLIDIPALLVFLNQPSI